jgi:hypothetical protein
MEDTTTQESLFEGVDNEYLASCLHRYQQYIEQKRASGYLPITSLDFSSLYPSLIMTYNLSPEYMLTPGVFPQMAESALPSMVKKIGKIYPIHDVEFDFNYEDHKGEKQMRHVKGWAVKHEEPKRFGLYPTILKDLFNQRSEIKKDLAVYEQKKEHMEAHFGKDKAGLASNDEYRAAMIKLKYLDTKQKALKVFMNTFYGECGNKNSPLFVLELAGGITSAGQQNLKMVKRFIEGKGCRVFYGDTDSLYFCMDESLFADITRRYLTSHLDKERYATELIDHTFATVPLLNKQVNDHLCGDNGFRYLKMAYEEVLYPAAFLARKKYYGIKHVGLINFRPKDIFIRGFEVKKRGVSEILRIVCMEAMWESMDVLNDKTLFTIVEEKISHLFNKTWEMEDFVATAMWKPNKENIPVKMFQQRMVAEGKTPVEPYERFSYVLCRITDPSKLFDYRGCKIEIKKGHMMEYLDVAKKLNMQVDIGYYFKKQLVGQFARLVSYDDRFVVDTIAPDSDFVDDSLVGDVDVDDKATMNNAKRYIMEISKPWLSDLSQYSNAYKNVYRGVSKKYAGAIASATLEFGNIFKNCTKQQEDSPIQTQLKGIIDEKVELFKQANEQKWKDKATNIMKCMIKETNSATVTLTFNANNKSQYSLAMRALSGMQADTKALIMDTIMKKNIKFVFIQDDDVLKEAADKYRKEVDALFEQRMCEAKQANYPEMVDEQALDKEVIFKGIQDDEDSGDFVLEITPEMKEALQHVDAGLRRLYAMEETMFVNEHIHKLHYEKKIPTIPKFTL